jgi:hypothetical protein
MNKKLLAILLTAAMTIGSAVGVFAAEPVTSVSFSGINKKEPTTGAIEHEGRVEEPNISITISALSGNVVANPYGLAIEGVEKLNDGTYPTLVGDTITISNNSNMKVSLGIKGALTGVGGDLTVLTSAPKDTLAKAKQLYVQAKVFDADTDAPLYTYTEKNGVITPKSEVAPLVYKKIANPEKDKPGEIALRPVLAAGDGTKPADAKGVVKVVISGATTFTTETEWTEADTFHVVTTFDIQATNERESVYSNGN